MKGNKVASRLALFMAAAVVVALGLSSLLARPALACYDWAPQDLEASVEDDEAVWLEWDAPSGYGDLTLSGYYVYRIGGDHDDEGQVLNDSPVTGRSFVDDTVESGETYRYWVTAYYEEEGESGPSNKVEVRIGGGSDDLPAPEKIKASVNDDTVRLEWSEPKRHEGLGLLGYNVYRRDAADESGRLNDSVVKHRSFCDERVEAGHTYWYHVTAVYKGKGESGPSDEVEVTVGEGGVASPPRELTVAPSEGVPKLTWLPPEDTGHLQLVGYYVYRAGDEGNYDRDPLNDFTVEARVWVDYTVVPGEAYRYRVTACYEGGLESAPSNEVRFRPAGTTVVLTIDRPTALVNGQEVPLDQPPTLVNGRTMLPFRFVAENFGATVSWDQAAQQVTAVYEETTVVLTVGSQTAYVNGRPLEVNVPPLLLGERVMVPLRFLANAFGWNLVWDNESRTVTVTVG